MIRIRSVLSHCAFHCSIIFAAGLLLLSGCQADKAAREKSTRAVLQDNRGVAIYTAGDIADCREFPPERSGAAKTAALIADRLATDPQATVITLGDNTYPIGLIEEFTHCYDPTWGKFKARTYPSPGNHEYYSPQATGYYSYFGAAAGPSRNGYYSFNLGGWHVVSLNSYLKPAQHQEQLAWLQADLARNPARCTLAFWHHPRYSSGGHGSNANMDDAWKLLAAAGAELLLSAHDHNYERFAPQDGNGAHDNERGIRQFVVGTGGAHLTPVRFRSFNSEVVDNTTHGVLKLVLKDAGYEWEFLAADGTAFTDSGAALCH